MLAAGSYQGRKHACGPVMMSAPNGNGVAGCSAFQEQAQGQGKAGEEDIGAAACCCARPRGEEGGVPGAAVERNPQSAGGQTETGPAEAQ